MASDANDLLNTTTVLTKDGAHYEKRKGKPFMSHNVYLYILVMAYGT